MEIEVAPYQKKKKRKPSILLSNEEEYTVYLWSISSLLRKAARTQANNNLLVASYPEMRAGGNRLEVALLVIPVFHLWNPRSCPFRTCAFSACLTDSIKFIVGCRCFCQGNGGDGIFTAQPLGAFRLWNINALIHKCMQCLQQRSAEYSLQTKPGLTPVWFLFF